MISFDIVPPPENAWRYSKIEWRVGDICDAAAVRELVQGADCVWHNAAAVGPFHPKALYNKVNHLGTLNVIEACKAAGVKKIVMSSSPSTRFLGSDVDGLTEEQMPALPLKKYLQVWRWCSVISPHLLAQAHAYTGPCAKPYVLPSYAASKATGPRPCQVACLPTYICTHLTHTHTQPYAASKAAGEVAMLAANCPDLMTVAVAPHQVLPPLSLSSLFLLSLLSLSLSALFHLHSPFSLLSLSLCAACLLVSVSRSLYLSCDTVVGLF